MNAAYNGLLVRLINSYLAFFIFSFFFFLPFLRQRYSTSPLEKKERNWVVLTFAKTSGIVAKDLARP